MLVLTNEYTYYIIMLSHLSHSFSILTISQLDEPLGHTVTVQEKNISLLL